MVAILVPVVEYIRPNGARSHSAVLVNKDINDCALFSDQLETMKNLGVEITVEDVLDGIVNVCLDDGFFDYKYLTVKSNELASTVARLVDEFDVMDYARTKREGSEFDCF